MEANTPETSLESKWDEFAETADQNKRNAFGEHPVGRPDDVRTKRLKGFRPRNVAPVTSTGGPREIYDGLKDLGPVLGDGGTGRADEAMLAFAHPTEDIATEGIAKVVKSPAASRAATPGPKRPAHMRLV